MKTIRTAFAALAALLLIPAAVSAADAPAVSVVVAPERKVLASDKPETAVVKVGLTGAALPVGDRPAVNLALVLDRSGSMQGDRIARAREAAIAAVQRLDERDYISVVVFDDRIDVLAGAQTASEANKSAIVEKLRTVEARGATAIFGGVSAGAAEIRKNLARKLVNRIVLLSDGAANVGPSSPEELGLLGASLVKEGVSVSTLGVGLGYNENLMAALATRSDGNTYFIENGGDIPRIFDAELGDAFQVAARDVKLSVRFRDAFPVELIGRDGRIEDGVVTVDFNQIYSRQEKYVLVRTEFPVGKDGETREFAAAEVVWTIPGAGGSGTASALGSIAFSADARKVAESADAKVLVQSVKTQNALRTNRALELNKAGRYEEAAQLMTRNVTFSEQVGHDFSSSFHADAAAAAELREESLWNTSNADSLGGYLGERKGKMLRTRSTQIETQQSVQQEGL